MSEVLGTITVDGVKYHLSLLKKDGKIERQGGTRGYWKINPGNKADTAQEKAPKPIKSTPTRVAEKILAVIKENPSLGSKKISEILGNITPDGVKYHLNILKKEGKIHREGGSRGFWKLND